MTDRSLLLKQRLWRWHLVAGLVVCPFAILLAITGSIYLFKSQIDGYEEATINALAAAGAPLSSNIAPSTHIKNLLAEQPQSQLKRLILDKPADRSVEIEIQNTQGENRIYWIDRISGQVLASKNSDQRFMQRIKKLHSELLMGSIGSYIVELMASWFIILIISGLYLWLSKPNSTQHSAQPAASELNKIKPSKKWRSLHTVTGLWFAIPITVLLLSGLPWTQLWGSGFDQVKALAGWQGPSQEWFVTLQSEKPETQIKPLTDAGLWQINSDPHAHHNATATVDIDALDLSILDIIRNQPAVISLTHPVQIIPPKPDNGVWTVRAMSNQRSKRETLHFDQYSAQLIQHIKFEDHHPVEQFISQGVSLHEGALFGWLNQLLGVLTALAIICLSGFGLYAWWLRKPQGQLGVPDSVDTAASAKLVVAIVLLGILLPAAGISFVVIYIIEWLGAKFDFIRRSG